MSRTRISIVAMFFLLAGCEKARLDDQVRELCAKDGGIKVYETITLPRAKFDKRGMVQDYDPTKGESTLGPEYVFKQDVYFYRKGNPQMSRVHFKIIRKGDGKLLGETVIYGRGGGDSPIPSPMHESSFHCPRPSEAGSVKLIQQVFMPL